MSLNRFLTVVIFLIGISYYSYSDQAACINGAPPCGPGAPPEPDCCDELNVPFDGGISLIIVAGIAIGISKKKKLTF